VSARVAYLVSQYPALSHAFIETEVEQLRALGAEVTTFSVRAARPEHLLTPRAAAEAAATTVLQEQPVPHLLRALAAVLRQRPDALPRVAALAAGTGPRTAGARLRQGLYLGEALVLWHHLSRAGLRHVHAHFANNGADIARLTAALGEAVDGPEAGWAWSMSMHGPTEFEDQGRWDLAAKAASAAWVACITDFCRSQLMRLLPPEEWAKLAVVRMGVDSTRFSPGPPRAAGGPLRVLTVGRLVPEKGSPLLLEALEQLVASGVDAELSVVGAGPLAGQLAERARRAGLGGRVRLLGAVGQDDLPALYRAADAFCLPSFAEGLPVVLMEAMACGLPVVTTTIAGIPELVEHRVTGLLVPPGRADLIAAALRDLALDPQLRASLGAAGRERVVLRHDAAAEARLLAGLLDPAADAR
jgi:glycosyltransferase involved in cell wall biosynthesis